MNGLVKFAIAGIGGISIGLISAQKIIGGYEGLFNKSQGPWVSWPTAGTRASNPYVRAHFLIQNRLPISQFEVNELEARTDSNGKSLDRDCTYEISGPAQKARWWSLYTYSNESSGPVGYTQPRGIGSHNILAKTDGQFIVKLSQQPQTGNWIMPTGGDDLVLVLRHYNPAQSITNQFNFKGLPSIIRKECK